MLGGFEDCKKANIVGVKGMKMKAIGKETQRAHKKLENVSLCKDLDFTLSEVGSPYGVLSGKVR